MEIVASIASSLLSPTVVVIIAAVKAHKGMRLVVVVLSLYILLVIPQYL